MQAYSRATKRLRQQNQQFKIQQLLIQTVVVIGTMILAKTGLKKRQVVAFQKELLDLKALLLQVMIISKELVAM